LCWRSGIGAQLVRRLRQADEEGPLAPPRPLEHELKPERRLSGSGVAFDEIEPAAGKAPGQYVIEAGNCDVRPNGDRDAPEADYTILHSGEVELGEVTKAIAEEVKRASLRARPAPPSPPRVAPQTAVRRIACYSQGLGKGAEFVVTLPTLPMTSEEPRLAKRTELGPQGTARVLLVEDNPDTAESLTMLLELLGHRVRAAHDGVAALDAARANIPDVMLVDIGLPGMDGYEVARRVRRDPQLKDVVLVALTGYGREEDKQQAMAAGFDYHLVKPVAPDALHGLVARLGKHEPKEAPTVH
jgi:CheY-like chemotaxis protein